MTTLKAGEHNPNSNHSSEVFSKIIKFKRNTVNRKNQGYVVVQKIKKCSILGVFKSRKLFHHRFLY